MKRLLEGQQLQRTVPPTAGRVEPVVRLPGGLTLDDRSCWQYPTMLVGNVGSGFSFGQNREVVTKPVLSQDDLTGLRNNSEFLVYNQDLMRLWVGKIG